MADRLDLAPLLLEVTENIQPIIEACEGQKAALQERGWSPTAAEQFATELLLQMIRAAFNGAR